MRRPKGRRSSARCLACRLRWCACPICTARGSRYRSESRRFCRGVRLRALLARFRRVFVAVPPPAWKWGVAVGVRWAVAMAMAVAFAVRLGGIVIVHAGIARALTSAHRSAGPCQGGTWHVGAAAFHRARQFNYATLVTPLEHGQHPPNCHSQSHTLYRHSTAVRTESLEPLEAALGKGSSTTNSRHTRVVSHVRFWQSVSRYARGTSGTPLRPLTPLRYFAPP